MAGITERLIQCIKDPPPPKNTQETKLNDFQKIAELIQKLKNMKLENNSDCTFNYNIARSTLFHGVVLNPNDSLRSIIFHLLQASDSVLINYGLLILRIFSANSNDSSFLCMNTPIFDKCKDYCSRNDEKVIINVFNLLTRFCYTSQDEANYRFNQNQLFDVIFPFCFCGSENIRIAAMRCISNYLTMNFNLFESLVHHQHIENFLTMLKYTSYKEKDEIFWLLFSLAKFNTRIVYPLFQTHENMQMMIDYLDVASPSTVKYELDVLYQILNSPDETSNIIHNLFMECGGYETLGKLTESNDEIVAEAAQIILNQFYP